MNIKETLYLFIFAYQMKISTNSEIYKIHQEKLPSIFEDGFIMIREYIFPSYGKVLFLAQETSFLYADFTTTSSPTITIVFCIKCTSN